MSYELMIVVFAVIILTAVYLVLLNARLVAVPPEAEAVCAVPWTPQDVLDGVQVIKNNLTDFKSMLPEPTGRRYVIVGGSGWFDVLVWHESVLTKLKALLAVGLCNISLSAVKIPQLCESPTLDHQRATP